VGSVNGAGADIDVEANARLSPDGHWLAYSSGNEVKRNEIYVQSFPRPVKQVSTNGGDHPVWSKDGKDLFFQWEVFSSQLAGGILVSHNDCHQLDAKPRALGGF